NISNHLALVWWLPEIGYNLLLFDYRGFGQSASRPTRAGTIDDGHGALDYLLTRKDVDPDRIVAYGQSIGGAVATVVAAARSEIRALIAETTFDSYRAIATDHLSRKIYSRFLADKIVRATIGSAHDPLEAIVALAPRPLLMIVAEEDQICFPERGMELYEAAREPKSLWRVPQAGHLGIERVASVELRRRVGDFLDAVCASSARNSP
ncbi:MAG: alpha/beta hydrolase, partial [Phycisphaerae bacterium]